MLALIMDEVVRITKDLPDDKHAQIYHFLQTQEMLQNATMGNDGIHIDLRICPSATLCKLANVVLELRTTNKAYVSVPQQFVLLTPQC